MILFNFASRSRATKFKSCVENIRDLASGNYFILAKVDDDDPCVAEYLTTPGVQFSMGLSGSKVKAINRNIQGEWDILVNMSDDILWTEKGFDDIIREHMEEDCFLHFPEEYADSQAQNKARDTISVVSIMDKKYYDRFGYVYHPDYKSLWCDNEATEVARRLGRYKHVDKKIFEHIHPAAGKAQRDNQYKHTEGFYWRDKAIFEKRKAMNFGL